MIFRSFIKRDAEVYAGMTLFKNKVGEVTVQDLLKKEGLRFFIPSYQRGYRWQTKQVRSLLNDFYSKWSQSREDNSKYLLQPIVLKEVQGGYIVVDGQQRLTTLKIMLEAWECENVWSITPLEYDTIDFLSDACKRNCERIVRKNAKFRDTVLNNLVRIVFVYYMLDEKEVEHKAFERLNAGKIGLTDAELIRALFIPHDNVWANEIASEWEQIENSLQDDAFWYMFNSAEPETETRIDRLFKIVTGQEQNKVKGSAFWEIESSIKSMAADSHDCIWWWNEVMNVYWMLRHCYDNIRLYHYLGWFAHTTDVRFGRIYDLYKQDQLNFCRNLQCNILGFPAKGYDLNCNSLYLVDERYNYDFRSSKGGFRYLHPYAKADGYPSCFIDKDGRNLTDTIRVSTKELRSFLLLFNLEMLNERGGGAERFPFKTYKDQAWDIEHIASHNPDADLQSDSQEELLSSEEKNLLWNLALLDKTTNCTYKDKPFSDKRQYIFGVNEKSVEGKPFVPVSTREVFSKAYSKDPSDMNIWRRSDAVDYLEYMTMVIKRMWDMAKGVAK